MQTDKCWYAPVICERIHWLTFYICFFRLFSVTLDSTCNMSSWVNMSQIFIAQLQSTGSKEKREKYSINIHKREVNVHVSYALL